MFFQRVVKSIFLRAPTIIKFYFTNSEVRENHFSTERPIGKYNFFKSRGSWPPATFSDANVLK